MRTKTYRFTTFPLIFAAIMMLAILTPHVSRSLGTLELTFPLGQTTVYDTEIANILTNVIIDPAYSHAIEEHPYDAPIVRDCLAQRGAYMQFQVEPKKRYLRVCIIDEEAGLIGFQIVDIVGRVAKEKTAYIKDSIHNIRQLLKYVERMGYPRFKGTL